MMQSSTELNHGILEAVGKGNSDAFRILYLQTSQTVYAYALSILHNPQDAEDAMQDTFLKIREAAHLYQSRGKPMAWIFTIVRNVCLMKLRQQHREADHPADTAKDEISFDRIENLENRMVLKAAMDVLDQEEIQIILLHAVTGMKHREISTLLEIPLSTVLSKYSRGLKKLRLRLEAPSCLTLAANK